MSEDLAQQEPHQIDSVPSQEPGGQKLGDGQGASQLLEPHHLHLQRDQEEVEHLQATRDPSRLQQKATET